MEPYIAYMLAAILGGVLGTIAPYLIKIWQEGWIKFDISYFYGMCVSMVLTVWGLVPTTGGFDWQTCLTVFFAALGINQVINKANAVRVAKKNGG